MKSQKLTWKIIEDLNPCKDSFNLAKNHYSKRKSMSIKEFLASTKIPHKDKLWVAFKLMPKKNLRFAAGEVAKTVLHVYEEKYPNDLRPRKAIEEALKPEVDKETIKAAYAAAYDAAAAKAYAAANAAYAAAYAAYAAAYVAADAAYAAANRKNDIEKLQLKIVAKYWKHIERR